MIYKFLTCAELHFKCHGVLLPFSMKHVFVPFSVKGLRSGIVACSVPSQNKLNQSIDSLFNSAGSLNGHY